MNKYLATLLIALPFIASCSTTEPTIQTGPEAEVVLGNLHRVDNARAGLVYVDPKADLSQYSKIMLDPLDTSKVEVVQPTSTVSARNKPWTLTEADEVNLKRHYREVFIRELEETGDYEIVGKAGPDVLRVTASITDISPNAPKDDHRSRAVGRTRVYTEGAGTMAISFGFSDSQSGDILAFVKDSRRGSPTWSNNNAVTNMSDVRFMFGHWARMIRARLDIVHGY